MEKLRKAIIAMAAEDISVADEMSEHTEAVIEAFNEMAQIESGRGVNITPITEDDIEKEFE
jgi:hypothetical protein